MTKRILPATLPPPPWAAAGRRQCHANDDPKTERAENADSEQPVGDTWITTKVKSSLLADEDVAGLQVDVTTVNGKVTLAGDVASQAQIDEARRIASGIEGVTDVDTTGLRVDASKSE